MKRWNEWRRNYLQWCQRHEKKRMRSKKTVLGMFMARFVPIIILAMLISAVFLYSEYDKEKYWRFDEDEMEDDFLKIPKAMQNAATHFPPYGDQSIHITSIDGDSFWLCAMAKEEKGIDRIAGEDGDWLYYDFLNDRYARGKDPTTYSVLITYYITPQKTVNYSYQITKQQEELALELAENPNYIIRSGWLDRGKIIIESYEDSYGAIHELSTTTFHLTGATYFSIPTNGDAVGKNDRFAGEDAHYGSAGGDHIAILRGVVNGASTLGVDWDPMAKPTVSPNLRENSIEELKNYYTEYLLNSENNLFCSMTSDGFGKRTFVGAYFQRIRGKDFGFYLTGSNSLRPYYYWLMFGVVIGGVFISLLVSFILAEVSYRRYKIDHDIYEYRMVLSNSMAHDLKSPLMVISGQAENLKETEDPDKRQEYADGIIHQVSYMNELIADVLELYKTENMDAEKNDHVGLRECIQEQADYFRDMIAEKKLLIQISGEKTITCDSSIRTMLRNLMENAVVHAPQEDTIQAMINDKGFSIENSLEQELSCEPKELLKPFVKGDSSRSGRKGNGLGLSIAKSICDAHGYRIKVVVEDGRFRVNILF